MKKIPVSVLGATGAVGQRFIQLLAEHPWFEVTCVCASEKSAGQKYKDAVSWKLSTNIPKKVANLIVQPCKPDGETKIAFSALDSSVAGKIEEDFANASYAVISNSKNHRMDDTVPLLIPEINPDHLQLIDLQKKHWQKKGFIVTNPNCTTMGLAIVLKPLNDAFTVTDVVMTSMQALSGAGYPGVSSMDIVDNVIPFIGDEEEKVESEPLKILGKLKNGKINFAPINISASCNRVAVRDGHLETVTIGFKKKTTVEEVIKTLEQFSALPQKLKLPSAPLNPIVYRTENDRPQPVLDRDSQNGMATVVGRVRESNVLDFKLTLLSHNTIRGAAGAAILNAELLKAKNLI